MPNEITSANAAQAILKLVAVQVFPALAPNFLMAALVNRDFEPVLGKAGELVNVPIAPDLTANNIAEGGTVQNQNANLGNAEIRLTKHLESTFEIPDVTRILVQPDLLATYMNSAILAVSTAVESDLLNLYPLFTANTAVGGASAIDEARVDLAETTLFNARVPDAQTKHLVVHSDPYGTLRQIPRFSEQLSYGTGWPIQSGEVMKIKNIFVHRSQLVPKPSTIRYNLAFTRNAIGLVTRRLPIPLQGTGAMAEYIEYPGAGIGLRAVMSYNPNTLAQRITIDCLYGVGVLRNNHAVQVQTN
jgi:hypothetical protein